MADDGLRHTVRRQQLPLSLPEDPSTAVPAGLVGSAAVTAGNRCQLRRLRRTWVSFAAMVAAMTIE